MSKLIECSSEEGITIGLIDTIINSFKLLQYRDLEDADVREAIKDLHSSKELRVFIARCLGFNADNLNEMYNMEQLNAFMENRRIGERPGYKHRKY